MAAGLAICLGPRPRRTADLALLAGFTSFAPVWAAWQNGPTLIPSLAMALGGFTFPLIIHLVLAYSDGRAIRAHSAIRQPSQYASTRGRRLPCSPISRTSGSLPDRARKEMSSPAAGAGLKPDTPRGGSVAACMYAGVPWQHIRGRAAQTHSRPPWARMKSAASGLTSTLTSTR
jgi:hypothetical protein